MGKPRREIAARQVVRVVYALPERQQIVDLLIDDDMDVEAAVCKSGLLVRHPEISRRPLACAIFGQPVALSRKVHAGDRIEILRPLAIDPKEQRRQSARAQQDKRRQDAAADGFSTRDTLSPSSKKTMK